MTTSASRYRIHLAFTLAALMMALMGWTLYEATTSEIDSSRMVGRTLTAIQSVAEINEEVSRAESAQRGYLLTGSGVFLSDRDEVLDRLPHTVARITQLTADNPGQQDRLRRLEGMIAVRVAIMQDSTQALLSDGIQSARVQAAIVSGQRAGAGIYALTAQMRQEEQRLLDLRRADAEYRYSVQIALIAIAAALGTIILIPAYAGFYLQARVRRQIEARLRLMADSLPGAMYQVRIDPQGRRNFTFASAGLRRGRGVPDSAPLAWEAITDAIDERDRPDFIAAMAESQRTLAPFRHDYRVTHAGDGNLRWLHHEATLQKEPDGCILVNGYLTDVTEQTQLKEALWAAKDAADSANRAKSTFLATMSHEIRTPMNGMLGMLELLSLSPLDFDQRATLEIVRVSSKSLLRIIDDILDFSKIEASKLEVRPEVTSIPEVMEGVHNFYSGSASGKGLVIRRSVDPGISIAVLVDPVRLRQILNNFVSNALKFTTEGSIEIRAELAGRAGGNDTVRFAVSDTGCGVSAEDQKLLFQPFSQAGSGPSRAGGTGLGLTICRRLAALMGGAVEMESEPGRGTRMILTLSLPVCDPAQLPKAEPDSIRDPMLTTTKMFRMAPSVAAAQAEGTLVLLVDDHPINRLLLMRQVNALGYAAESAENGVEALGKWKSGRFGMVITDCNMPEMDGYRLAGSIRGYEADSGGTRVPIVACTANALGGDAETCFASGMDDYLVKPVELAQLLKKLDQWLPIPRAMAPGAGRPPGPPALTAPAAGAAPLDRATLAAYSDGDRATEREILRHFRRVNDEDSALLGRAVATGDLSLVAHAVHRIKGACRAVGATGLAGVSERIENAVLSRDLTTMEIEMGEFRREWVRLNAYVGSY